MSEADYAKHQAKVKRSYWAIDKSELANLPAKRPAEPTKRPKYGNEVVIEDGIRMASRKEMKRYRELGLLLKAGEIHWLCRQVRFILPGGIEYVCDFFYGTLKCSELGLVTIGAFTVEDVKSTATINNRVFLMKKALMRSTYNVEIIET